MSIASLGAFAEGFAGSVQSKRDRKAREEDSARKDRWLDIMEKEANRPLPSGGGMSGGMGAFPNPGQITNSGGGAGVTANADGSISRGGAGAGGSFAELLRRTEGAGDYDTLFSHAQRDGGQFAGVRPSQMTLDELYTFTDPKGDYGRWVAQQNNGTVATPVGAGQIVGSTMRRAAQQMGLSGDTRFTPEVQDAMINHLASNRLRGLNDSVAKRRALRNEWHGFRNVSDAELDSAISGFEASNNRMGALRPVS